MIARGLTCALALFLVMVEPLKAEGEHLAVQDAVRKFVAETGIEVIGLGSWIEGSKYTPGTSDHDLRMIIPDKKISPLEAERRWAQARGKLKSYIEDAVKKTPGLEMSAGDVLAKTNFYPPDQMMAGVPDMDKAWMRFKETGSFPNLAAQADKAKIEAAEGLYGSGAKIWRQEYEVAKGAHFYRDAGGKVVEGSARAVHFAEGVAVDSAIGRANTARQWAEHAWDEIRHVGDGRTVGKYLQRMSGDLEKAMELGELANKPAWLAEAKALGNHLSRHPEEFAKHKDAIKTMFREGHRQGSIVKGLVEANISNRSTVAAIAEACSRGPCIIDKIRRSARAAGSRLSYAHALVLAGVAVDLAVTGNAKTEKERAKAIYSAIGWSVNLPVGVLSMAVDYGFEAAEDFGAGVVSRSQDVWNMMEGDYSAYGRAKVDSVSWPLDRLLREIHDEDKLRYRVEIMANRASARGFGKITGETDAKVATRLFNNAWPVVFKAWTLERKRLMQQIDLTLHGLAIRPALMTYVPNPAEASRKSNSGSDISTWDKFDVEARLDDSKRHYQTAIAALRAQMALVGETARSNVLMAIKWDNGKPGDDLLGRKIEVDKPGRYKVSGTLIIATQPLRFPYDSDFARSIDIPIAVTVVVQPPDIDTSVRTAIHTEIEPKHTEQQCESAFRDVLLKFDFPPAGGDITNFVYHHKWTSGTDCGPKETCYVKCVSGSWESTGLIEGKFEGGDGGEFIIYYNELFSFSDAPEKSAVAGRLFANGTGYVYNEEAPGNKGMSLAFSPF